MARYSTFMTDKGIQTNWKIGRLEDTEISHKHQETLYLRYKGKYKFPFMELVCFSYPSATKFLKKFAWTQLPWVFDREAASEITVAKQQKYVTAMGEWLADLMSESDRDHLVEALKVFVKDVDRNWMYRSRKRRVGQLMGS